MPSISGGPGGSIPICASLPSTVQRFSEVISSGGVDISGTINDGGVQRIMAGGSASATVINDPGSQTVSSGATVTGTVVSGGVQDVYGTAISTTVMSGDSTSGVQIVESGGVASITVLSNGGYQNVLASGLASVTTVFGCAATTPTS